MTSPERVRARALLGTLVAALWVLTGCASVTPRPDLGQEWEDAPERRDVTRTQQAVLGALHEIEGTTHRIAESFPKLAANPKGFQGRFNGLFLPFVDRGAPHLRWIDGALKCSHRWALAAEEVADPDMQRSLLRLTGPRLQSALFGSLLLAAWLDYLNLVEAVLKDHCPPYSGEHLVRETDRVWKLLEPTLVTLSSLDPAQLESTASALPGLMDQLTREFNALREAIPRVEERHVQILLTHQLLTMATTIAALKIVIPQLPPVAPVALGAGLVLGAEGMTLGGQVVVSTEWMELLRRLVQAGIISLPAASAVLQIQAGHVMRSQAPDALPKGLREALGDGPEVDGMRATDRKGAGMAERPQHHVLPREHREWFEKRGFTDEMSIDHFCVEMEQAEHEAIHGGGNWRLGRTWSGEWNRMLMGKLRDAEAKAGRMLNRKEILDITADEMRDYDIPMNFAPWRGR